MSEHMNEFELNELEKKATELEDRINEGQMLDRKIKRIEEDHAYYSREEKNDINEMQEKYATDKEFSALLDEEYYLANEEERKFAEFIDEHRENLNKEKARYEDLQSEIRLFKGRNQWETE